MAWVILRFVLLAPAIACFMFNLIDSPQHQAIALSTFAAIANFVFACAVVSLYGLVFAFPVTGALAAICGFIYGLVLTRNGGDNFPPSLRMLVGGLSGFFCATIPGTFVLLARGATVDVSGLLPWSVAGTLSGAICALTVGKRLHAQLLSKYAT
jgi:hypothetical protein